ncbi:hypothetical protein PPYR_07437 [Photinus pyralis]|uniref:Major facilitator superfamily (MFS) profile domain-containing protein n=1 Tax=Photinus pyralis TaxID=7054 RepID=A0A5N4AQE8_PHOPY|nr:facilitated trehalose transporter Tret1-like [Photinus pyralis]KAB0799557.1 hypothetical protein PPYR_07437 [Photinus pyralis]
MLNEEHITRKPRYLQYFAAFCVGLLQLSQCASLSWGSPTLSLLLKSDSPIGKPITIDDAAWMFATIYFGVIVGCVFLVLLLEILGPKQILIAGAILAIMSWIVLGISKSLEMLVIGRVIAGVGDGLSSPCISIYICEIASNDIRGRLGAIPLFVGIFGNLFLAGAGRYLEYTTLIVSCAVFPITFLVLFSLMPDSPYFLMKKGRRFAAERNLMRLLGVETAGEVAPVLREVEETVEREIRQLTFIQSLLTPQFRQALLIVFVGHNIVNFCGLPFMSAYLHVLASSGSISMSDELTSLFFRIVQVPAVVFGGLLVDKLGRKPLLCLSSQGASVALFGLGAYIYLDGVMNLETVSFLPVLCLTMYGFFVFSGILMYLPYFVVGEIFTARTKKVGCLVVTCYSSVIVFFQLQISGSMYESWGLHTICWLFGGVCFLGVLFGVFLLPETKGKSFAEIQSNLRSAHEENNASRIV